MITVTATNAKKGFYNLIDQTVNSHEPVIIAGKRNNVIMISEKNQRQLEETLYLNSIPGLSKDIDKKKK